MSHDDPVTKGELDERLLVLEERLEDKFDGKLQEAITDMMRYYDRQEMGTRQHFDAALEDAVQQFLGAKSDQVSSHNDKLADHGQRIGRLETITGIG